MLVSSEVPEIRFNGPVETEEHTFWLTVSSYCQRNNNKKRRKVQEIPNFIWNQKAERKVVRRKSATRDWEPSEK
jgi:hypothetical protein